MSIKTALPTTTTPTSTGAAQNGIAYTTAATGTAAHDNTESAGSAAPAHVSWVGWGLVGASLLAAGATVVAIETDVHWTDIVRWLRS